MSILKITLLENYTLQWFFFKLLLFIKVRSSDHIMDTALFDLGDQVQSWNSKPMWIELEMFHTIAHGLKIRGLLKTVTKLPFDFTWTRILPSMLTELSCVTTNTKQISEIQNMFAYSIWRGKGYIQQISYMQWKKLIISGLHFSTPDK